MLGYVTKALYSWTQRSTEEQGQAEKIYWPDQSELGTHQLLPALPEGSAQLTIQLWNPSR